jgi:hypothetical protein
MTPGVLPSEATVGPANLWAAISTNANNQQVVDLIETLLPTHEYTSTLLK